MKSVVNAVTAIVEDVRAFERRPARERAEVDLESLHALRERAEATLSNLVAAAKTHATSAGMSPVSLLDAAASHVSLTVTEIGKTICIRKATKAEQDRFGPTSPPASAASPTAFSPIMRSIDERNPHKRGGSSTSIRSGFDRLADLASSPPRSALGRSSLEERMHPQSDFSSSPTSSPAPTFDRSANVTSDESATADGPEDAWSELKVRRQLTGF